MVENKKKEVIGMFIDYGVTKDCVNSDSYGEICVKCNQCGRFNKKEKEKEDGKVK